MKMNTIQFTEKKLNAFQYFELLNSSCTICVMDGEYHSYMISSFGMEKGMVKIIYFQNTTIIQTDICNLKQAAFLITTNYQHKGIIEITN